MASGRSWSEHCSNAIEVALFSDRATVTPRSETTSRLYDVGPSPAMNTRRDGNPGTSGPVSG